MTNDQGEWKASYTVNGPASNAFCAGHSQQADGSILIVGGDRRAMPGYLTDGIQDVRIYASCKEPECQLGNWNAKTPMKIGRWYPTVVTLADGR